MAFHWMRCPDCGQDFHARTGVLVTLLWATHFAETHTKETP